MGHHHGPCHVLVVALHVKCPPYLGSVLVVGSFNDAKTSTSEEKRPMSAPNVVHTDARGRGKTSMVVRDIPDHMFVDSDGVVVS